jgi:hypothetical protein
MAWTSASVTLWGRSEVAVLGAGQPVAEDITVVAELVLALVIDPHCEGALRRLECEALVRGTLRPTLGLRHRIGPRRPASRSVKSAAVGEPVLAPTKGQGKSRCP